MSLRLILLFLAVVAQNTPPPYSAAPVVVVQKRSFSTVIFNGEIVYAVSVPTSCVFVGSLSTDLFSASSYDFPRMMYSCIFRVLRIFCLLR